MHFSGGTRATIVAEAARAAWHRVRSAGTLGRVAGARVARYICAADTGCAEAADLLDIGRPYPECARGRKRHRTQIAFVIFNFGFQVCADLITALIRFYIGDDANTSAISDRLRQLCPSLFTVDDASVVQATESIFRAKASAQPRHEIVREAVTQLRKSIQRLNLIQTCDLLVQGNIFFNLGKRNLMLVHQFFPISVLYFEGIVDLALTRALRDDPNDLALIAYKVNKKKSKLIHIAITFLFKIFNYFFNHHPYFRYEMTLSTFRNTLAVQNSLLLPEEAQLAVQLRRHGANGRRRTIA